MKDKIKWINCAKTIAILAVLIDHTAGIAYSNDNITRLSYFSVSLFVLISGMLRWKSNEKHQRNYIQSVKASCKSIVLAYLMATFVYHIVDNHRFDFEVYVQQLIYFNASSPFYYVMLYIQLMFIDRLLYTFIKKIPIKYDKILEFGFGCVLLVFVCMTTNRSNILGIYGGGGVLFGGTYLLLFYIGMLLSKHRIYEKVEFKRSCIFTVLFLFLSFCWWRFECVNQFKIDSYLPFGRGVNPPSISLTLMALLILNFSFGFFTLCEQIEKLSWITNIFGSLGKHTLYVFLYHRLYLDYFLRKYITMEYGILKLLIYFGVMIAGSILLEYFFVVIKKMVIESES